MAHYGIIGSGTCGDNIIEDGLSEIGVENNIFLIYPRKGATPSEDRVYDYVLENEAEYFAYVKSAAPKVLVDNASKVFDVTGEDAWLEIIRTLKSKDGTLLVLWDADNEENITNLVFKAMDMGIKVLELSNGLAPFYVEAPEPQESTDVVEIEPFSDDELRSMSVGVLRKAATARGISDVGNYSKEELVSMLVDKQTHKEVLPEEDKPKAHTSTIEFSIANVSTTKNDLSGVLIYSDNGILKTLPLDNEVVAQLLGRG